MTAGPLFSSSVDPTLLDETVEMVLDTRQAVCEVLADTMPFDDLDALLRQLAEDILDTYAVVASEHESESGR
ncbi:MAG: hypothetical protein AAF962_18965 [Actinomycetota bacterium]